MTFTVHAPSTQASKLDVLREQIVHAAHLLPAQGPITVFIHHNTLHAFEELPFSTAVVEGSKTFGCLGYLPEQRYRRELERERIRVADLHSVLLDELGDTADLLIGCLGTRLHLRLAMLCHPLWFAPVAELQWLVEETDALQKFREDVPGNFRQRSIEAIRHWIMRDFRDGKRPGDAARNGNQADIASIVSRLFEAFDESSIERWTESTWESFSLHLLWRICRRGVEQVPPRVSTREARLRHRDVLYEATGEDSDLLVHDILIRFCAAYLDQGFAPWPLPHRAEGFYRAFFALYREPGGIYDRWLHGLRSELERIASAGMSPLESIAESLERLGVEEAEQEAYLSATLLALRGWAGMIWQLETRGDRAAHPAPPGTLTEFLAIRLILDRLALQFVAHETLGFDGPLDMLRPFAAKLVAQHRAVSAEQRAFLIFQLAQLRGWKAEELYRFSIPQWSALVNEIESFSSMERRRIFHLAFERRYRIQALDAVRDIASRNIASLQTPTFQVVCCIDEREESFRRHLEEIRPDVETFGAAGFFGVAMYYRGAADAHYVPLCPVVIRPQHFVQEDAALTFAESHRRRAETRRFLGTASHRVHLGSRTFLGGALAALFGPLASIPLVMRVLFPRLTSRIRLRFGELMQPPPVTQLILERTDPLPGSSNGQIGFSVDEMAAIVERLLRDMGLTSRYSRLIIVVGHGSSSNNNPHRSAYDCGACGGAHGGPNARALARMANDPRVRRQLFQRGISLPDNVVFIGALHNTCNDSVTYFDLDRLPISHRGDFELAKNSIDEARQRNAHERCRRFESAPLSLNAESALRHVESRSEDLAQARPECGHATNAICYVGRRARTRGLFFDRRAFLTSYDATQDDAESSILTRILAAVVPVCGGINLEYYFSYTDPTGWGSGTKLPHNLTSLLGVMDGAASDLRTGLPWQMVEIHEPVRLLFIIETTPEAMLQIIERNPAIGATFRNGWVQLATLDPHHAELQVYREGRFEPYEPEKLDVPQVQSSQEWYRGWRDHLGFAVVQKESSSPESAITAEASN